MTTDGQTRVSVAVDLEVSPEEVKKAETELTRAMETGKPAKAPAPGRSAEAEPVTRGPVARGPAMGRSVSEDLTKAVESIAPPGPRPSVSDGAQVVKVKQDERDAEQAGASAGLGLMRSLALTPVGRAVTVGAAAVGATVGGGLVFGGINAMARGRIEGALGGAADYAPTLAAIRIRREQSEIERALLVDQIRGKSLSELNKSQTALQKELTRTGSVVGQVGDYLLGGAADIGAWILRGVNDLLGIKDLSKDEIKFQRRMLDSMITHLEHNAYTAWTPRPFWNPWGTP